MGSCSSKPKSNLQNFRLVTFMVGRKTYNISVPLEGLMIRGKQIKPKHLAEPLWVRTRLINALERGDDAQVKLLWKMYINAVEKAAKLSA
jgi:hypothetical protein